MRLPCGGELGLDADVELLRARNQTPPRLLSDSGFAISSSPSSSPKKRRAAASQPEGAAN